MSLKFINENTGEIKTAIFCFTGKSPKTRPEMETIAINAGAQVTRSVNGRTTILVIADANSNSCKAESARDRDIDLISPAQFFLMCNSIFPIEVCKTKPDTIMFSGQMIHIKKPKPLTKPTEKRKHSSVRRIQL